ncbi:hypothetical protein Tco_1290934, partial [Tanacetum coccineum]
NGTKEKDHEVKPRCNTNTSHRHSYHYICGVTAALAARDATRNGDDSHTSRTGARRPVQVARECTFSDFLKCKPLNFKGIEGVVGLTQWKCSYMVELPRTTTLETAHAMPWRTLKKMMTDKYCPRGTDVVTYSQRFQELALMYETLAISSGNIRSHISASSWKRWL